MSTAARLERLERLEKTVAARPARNPFADLTDDELSAKIIKTILAYLVQYRDPQQMLLWLKNGWRDGTGLSETIGKLAAGLTPAELETLENEVKKCGRLIV